MRTLGAIAVKQGVYVLPDSPAAREDFEWLKTEIQGAGGEATAFAAAHVDTWSDDDLVESFRRSRQDAYAALTKDLEAIVRSLDVPRRGRGRRPPTGRRLLQVFRERLAAIERVDLFGSAGRDRVIALLAAIEERISQRPGADMRSASLASADPSTYRGRLWGTRPRPGVDRMSSAWLIRRFIDPEARFGFGEDRKAAPRDALPFDMFGVEFTYHDDRCTFETLCHVFGVTDPAVARIAWLVHDLDLKDSKFGAPEAPAV